MPPLYQVVANLVPSEYLCCLCLAGIYADLLLVLCSALVVVGSVACLLDWIDSLSGLLLVVVFC
jgi:hypothetical protein